MKHGLSHRGLSGLSCWATLLGAIAIASSVAAANSPSKPTPDAQTLLEADQNSDGKVPFPTKEDSNLSRSADDRGRAFRIVASKRRKLMKAPYQGLVHTRPIASCLHSTTQENHR
jgi:hypothetical protein